jgi:hypothetical protein
MSVCELSADHEARHAAVALLRGLPIVRASALPDLDAGELGHVQLARGTVRQALELDPGRARDIALMTLVGDIGEPGWPPEGCRPRRRPRRTSGS